MQADLREHYPSPFTQPKKKKKKKPQRVEKPRPPLVNLRRRDFGDLLLELLELAELGAELSELGEARGARQREAVGAVMTRIEMCCACGVLTTGSVSFVGSSLVVAVPCCEDCQANLTADVRWLLVAAARDREQATARSVVLH